MSTNSTDIVVDATLEKFRERVWADIQRINTQAEWCVELYEVAGIKPPHSLVYGIYENMTCYVGYRYGEDPVIDIEATQVELAKVIQFARMKKYAVEKKYSDESFTVTVSIPFGEGTTSAKYYAQRKSVCKPKITKTVTVPATTREEVVEWDCAPVAFSKIDTGIEKPELSK